MHATFRQLQTFETVAKLGSFTLAAEALGLTEATVSVQVAKLVGEIGMPVFERIGRRVRLTPAGHELSAMSREVFAAHARLEMTIADMRGMKKGVLRLGAVTTAKYFVPRLLGMFSKKYPEIVVSLEIANREKVLARLKDGADDLYVFGKPPTDLDFRAIPFLDNHLIAVAAKDHPLATMSNIAFSRLAEEQFILRERGSGTRDAVATLFRKYDLQIRERMEFASNEAIKQAVIGGLGVSILSRNAVETELANGRLVSLNVTGLPIIRDWYVVYPNGKRLSVAAQAFVDHLLESSNVLSAGTEAEHTGAAGRA